MVNQITFRVRGADKLEARMNAMGGSLDAAKAEFVQTFGEYCFQATQEACPVDQGTLKFSGRLETTPTGFTIVYDAPHSRHVEYGWTRTDPIYPVNKRALSWEANRKGRLLAGAPASAGKRVVVAKVTKPASYPGHSYVRVPLQRSLLYMRQFWDAALKKHMKGAK